MLSIAQTATRGEAHIVRETQFVPRGTRLTGHFSNRYWGSMLSGGAITNTLSRPHAVYERGTLTANPAMPC